MEASSSSRYIDQYVFRYNHKGLCVKHTVVGLLELGLVREVRHGVQLHLGCISKEFVVDALLKGGC